MNSAKDEEPTDSIQFSGTSQENKSFIKEFNSAISKANNEKQPSENLTMSNHSNHLSTIIINNFKQDSQIENLNNKIKELQEKVISLEKDNKTLNDKLIAETLNRTKKEEEIQSLKEKLDTLTNEYNELKLSTEHKDSQKYFDSSLKLKNMNSVNDLSDLLGSNLSEDLSLKKAKSTKISKSNLKKDFINSKQMKEKQIKKDEDKIKKENEVKKIITEEIMEREKLKIINDFKKNHNIPNSISDRKIKEALISSNYDENKAAELLSLTK